MDLLHAIDAFKQILGAFTDTPDAGELWAADEKAFEQHFGESYETFTEILSHLSPEQEERFEATMRVNPEAAVLWILAMEEVEG
jgi:hypothetical protein